MRTAGYVLLTITATLLRIVELLSRAVVDVLGRLAAAAVEVLGLVVELLGRLADAADPAVATVRPVVVTTARPHRRPAAAAAA